MHITFFSTLFNIIKQRPIIIALTCLILGINIIRFIDLHGVPNGFMFDEETSGVTLQCLVETGNAPLSDEKLPLFAELGVGNPKPPTYLYPGVIWVKFFGFSEASIRALTASSFIVGLLGLFFLGRHTTGTLTALWAVLAGSLSPWMWSLSRMGIEGPFLLPYLIWGLYFALSAKRIWQFILAGALLAATVYTYPTAKMQAPILILLLGIYGKRHLAWKRHQLLLLIAAFFITLIPLIYFKLSNPMLNEHFKDVFITNAEYLHRIGKTDSIPDLISVFISRAFYQISPDYLFFKGTPTDMGMTTGRQGLLSWLDGLALLMAAYWVIKTIIKKDITIKSITSPWIIFMGINIFIGTLPAPFCHNNDPLHSIAAWPFMMLATGMVIDKTTKRWALSWVFPYMIAIIFAAVFFSQYFTSYRNDSVWIFRKWSSVAAQEAKTQEDWMKFLYFHHQDGFASRYFLMRYHGDNCTQAKKLYDKLKPVFEKLAVENKMKNNN